MFAYSIVCPELPSITTPVRRPWSATAVTGTTVKRMNARMTMKERTTPPHYFPTQPNKSILRENAKKGA
jgi:hypothetical protein